MSGFQLKREGYYKHHDETVLMFCVIFQTKIYFFFLWQHLIPHNIIVNLISLDEFSKLSKKKIKREFQCHELELQEFLYLISRFFDASIFHFFAKRTCNMCVKVVPS